MRTLAIIYGIVFAVLGILGFIPVWFVEGLLLSLFEVSLWLNVLYLVTGGCGLFVAILPLPYVCLYFQVVGIVYTIIGIGGFVFLDRQMLFFLANNSNNTWLAITAGVIALVTGFGYRSRKDE